MQRATESPLFESVREWVLRRLPIDQNDTDLVAHLEAKDAHGLLVVFHNWQSRMISVELRKVLRSSVLNHKALAAPHKLALSAIISDIEVGNPLIKYLSRGIKIAADLPNGSPNLQRRRDLDLMLNAWGIYHLHLSTSVEADGFVSRTGPLLFAVFNDDCAYLLDVMEHGSWTSSHLLEVLVREFPDSGAFHIMEGVVGLSYEPDEDGRRALRKHGVNSLVMIDGKAVMPAPGMVCAGTTFAATRESDMLLLHIEDFERAWVERPREVRDAIAACFGVLPDTPDFAFEICDIAGPGILEKRSMIFIPLFGWVQAETSTWAMDRL